MLEATRLDPNNHVSGLSNFENRTFPRALSSGTTINLNVYPQPTHSPQFWNTISAISSLSREYLKAAASWKLLVLRFKHWIQQCVEEFQKNKGRRIALDELSVATRDANVTTVEEILRHDKDIVAFMEHIMEYSDYPRMPGTFSEADADEVGGCPDLLMAAIEGRSPKIVQLLLENGANPNRSIRKLGMPVFATALGSLDSSWESCYSGQGEIISRLGNKGADYQRKTPDGDTLLNPCSRFGNLELMQTIINSGARGDISFGNTDEWTPLHWAWRCGKKKVVEFLLREGANANAIALKNYTPLRLTVTVKVSEQSVVDYNEPTPNLKSDFRERCDILKVVLQCKADPLIRDQHNVTPKEHATKSQRRTLDHEIQEIYERFHRVLEQGEEEHRRASRLRQRRQPPD